MTSELLTAPSARAARRQRLGSARSDRVPGEAQAVVVAIRPWPDLPKPGGAYVRLLKPTFDRLAAVAALVIAAVPMAVTAAAVAVTMGRPVLFRQRRIGEDGQPFEVLKFRTMRPDRRGQRLDVIHDRRLTHKSERDPRHTRVGRTLRRYSLDELPQLINVVRGEMSIVGPRPELEAVVANYPDGLHQRHHVKPGLTGMWQVSARGSGPMHENGQWDLAYVEQISLRTDLRILARTPRAVLAANVGS